MAEVPGPLVVRPVVPADAVRLLELISRNDERVLGHPDVTLADVVATLADPSVDLGQDSCAVLAPDGGLAGWCCLRPEGDGSVLVADLAVHPDADRTLWATLAADLVRRAAGHASRHGLASVLLDTEVVEGDDLAAAALRLVGFSPVASFARLRRDLDGGEDGLRRSATAAAGVDVGRGPLGDEALRAVHALKERAFARHFGYAPQAYDTWLGRLAASESFDWPMLLVARVDGVLAGMAVCTDQFVEDENSGWVSTLAVDEEFRRRGVGAALLTTAFADAAAAGRRAVMLGVDVENVTGALHLYEQLGMRVLHRTDVWRRTVGARTQQAHVVGAPAAG